MYEVNEREKELRQIILWLKKCYKAKEIDGLLIIKTSKDGELSLRSIQSSLNEYEWVGILEHVKDLIKDEHYNTADTHGDDAS